MTSRKYHAVIPEPLPSVIHTPNPSAPVYDPAIWSDAHMEELGKTKPYKNTQLRPNCYAYATQAPSFTDPGTSVKDDSSVLPPEGSLSSISSAEMQKRIRRYVAGFKVDGMQYLGQQPPDKLPPHTYLIAYYQLPPKAGCDNEGCISDFHFVRQDRDGSWSQKMGQYEPPQQTDSTGKKITDPRTADIHLKDGRKYQFVGFLLAPEGGVSPGGVPLPNAGVNALKSFEGGDPDTPNLQPGEALVARFTRPDNHYNKYLQRGADGKWTDNPGYSAPTDKDGKGNVITNPKTAFFDGFNFTGYFIAPDGTQSPSVATLPAASKKNTPPKSTGSPKSFGTNP